MASNTRIPGAKTPGVYGAQYQHPPHLMPTASTITNVMPSPILAPGGVTNTSVYGVQPGQQGMVVRSQIPGGYPTQMFATPVNLTAIQKQMKQKELHHQQQQEKIRKEKLFQEQKQRLQNMTGATKGKQLSVEALMDSYLKPSAMKPTTVAWQPSSGIASDVATNGAAQTSTAFSSAGLTSQPNQYSSSRPVDPTLGGWQDRDVPEIYLQTYHATLNAGGLIDTNLLYPILLTSGLPRELLGHVWSLSNKSIPGQLTKSELFYAMAMIGFIQSGNNPSDLPLFCQSPRPFSVVLSLPSPAPPVPPIPSVSLSALPPAPPLSSASLTTLSDFAHYPLSSSSSLSGLAANSQHDLNVAAFPDPQLELGSRSSAQSLVTQLSQPSLALSQCPPPLSQNLFNPAHVSSLNPGNPQGFLVSSANWDLPVTSVHVVSLETSATSFSQDTSVSPQTPASSSTTSVAFQFPPAFPPNAESHGVTSGLSTASFGPSGDPPALRSSASAGALPRPPLSSETLTATPASFSTDKYAAFKDLRPMTEVDDDFADFVVATEVTAEPTTGAPTAPSVLVAGPDPAGATAATAASATTSSTAGQSATEKIIENLNSFSISSKSRKSSSEEFDAFAVTKSSEEGWADFSHGFAAFSSSDMTPAAQTNHAPGIVSQGTKRQIPVASAANDSSDFGDFVSRPVPQTSALQSTVTAPNGRPAAPRLSNDGYHFSDPFFSPDEGEANDFSGFVSGFSSKEATPIGEVHLSAKNPVSHLIEANGVSRGSSIAAETQSVSSLELPAATSAASQSDSDSLNGHSTENNSVTSEDPGSGVNGVNSIANVAASSANNSTFDEANLMARKLSAAAMTNRLPLIGDRYSAVIDDLSASEKHAMEWTKCLKSCLRMIEKANSNLSNLTSAAACLEFITARKGLEYLTGIVEIYRVSCRILASMKALGVANKELVEISRDIEIVWQNLTSFLAKSPSIMPEPGALDFSDCVVRKSGMLAGAPLDKLCGVCLLYVDGKSRANNPLSGDTFKLSYGGRQYHASCANLWVNCVNPILPALVLPSPFM